MGKKFTVAEIRDAAAREGASSYFIELMTARLLRIQKMRKRRVKKQAEGMTWTELSAHPRRTKARFSRPSWGRMYIFTGPHGVFRRRPATGRITPYTPSAADLWATDWYEMESE